MPVKRAFRPLLVTATLAATVAATAVGVMASGATAGAPAPPRLNVPWLHARLAAPVGAAG